MVVKLQDVAQKAGVSVTTVSRVINNYGSLSQKTIDKVHQAMHDLKYQPNALARAMQGKPSKFIGLIFPSLTNPFFAELANEVEIQLFAKGFKTIIASSTDNEQIENEYLKMLVSNQVDGIISSSHNNQTAGYQNTSVSVVSFDRNLGTNIPIVSSDNYQGGRLTAEYMIQNHAQKVCVSVDEDTSLSPTILRIQGVIDTLSKADVEYVPIDFNKNQMTDVLPGDFDGIIASNDVAALRFAAFIRKSGKRPFKDVLITGYDGSRLIRSVAPELPTVIQPVSKIATALIDNLIDIAHSNPDHAENAILPVTFYSPS
ncbi:HTH-type transcriptional regulator DegA [Lentilactobacillus sunkii]|jgi:LacI family sucrose operon transcriptional repressor|uniref:HTH-type transcriptional regulator DegA n=1 Tax=Lentilactobacillus sunkii TaxID=481719 RepID=A0A1E7XGK5_9LACO|nr:LacI family DNA-binding transcriptional regulator [Lentilactobacillus sunkii]OFA12224.1 HTH-type transcriptional regulator DegA [Lentilactobacillus sunkii]